MKKIAVLIMALILAPTAIAGNGSVNYGGIKVGDCKQKNLELSTSAVIDEYEVGTNAVLISANGTSVTVSLCATSKGKFSSFVAAKNSGTVLSSLNLQGVGN